MLPDDSVPAARHEATFNEAFNLGESSSGAARVRERSATRRDVKALIGPMMGELTAVGFIAGPYGSLLRFAEGIDSLRNLGKTGDMTLTNAQRGSAIVCSIAQLGGMIWMATSIIFLAIFCVCAPVGSWCCLRGLPHLPRCGRARQRREEALDDLIEQQAGSIDAAPSQRAG